VCIPAVKVVVVVVVVVVMVVVVVVVIVVVVVAIVVVVAVQTVGAIDPDESLNILVLAFLAACETTQVGPQSVWLKDVAP